MSPNSQSTDGTGGVEERARSFYEQIAHNARAGGRSSYAVLHEAVIDTGKWVDGNKTIYDIKDLETKHLKNILNALNMGDECYGQGHKKDTLRLEYDRRLPGHDESMVF